jgi:NTP pyrophosphatase (non-canonical NTP hydrolase)
MRDVVGKIRQWAMDRKIIHNSTPMAQLLKTVSELGELADATLKGRTDDQIDGVGDVVVTLVIYSELAGIDFETCVRAAYDQIKDRTGTLTAEGVFVKDEPLPTA